MADASVNAWIIANPQTFGYLIDANGLSDPAYVAYSDRVAWLRAPSDIVPPGGHQAPYTGGKWTAKRRWSSYGSEVDAQVLSIGQSRWHSGHWLTINESDAPGVSTGSPGGYNRMYRLTHTGTLDLKGATQLHVNWSYSDGADRADVRLILDGVRYTKASQVWDNAGMLYRTTFDIPALTSVNTVSVEWEGVHDGISAQMWRVYFDDIVRTPPVAPPPSRTAALSARGGFTAVTTAIESTPRIGATFSASGTFTATARAWVRASVSAALTTSGSFAAATRVTGAVPAVGAVLAAGGVFTAEATKVVIPTSGAQFGAGATLSATTTVISSLPSVGAVLGASDGVFTAVAVTGGVHPVSGQWSGEAGEFTASVDRITEASIGGGTQTGTGVVLDGSIRVPAPAFLLIVNPELDQTPDLLDVRVTGVEPLAEVTFSIDGTAVETEVADSGGNILALSVPVSRTFTAGEHTVTATTTGTAAQATFTVTRAPNALPPTWTPDAPPVPVDGSAGENGVYRWVLQDRAPGGIGSWVMPINPSSMANPHVRKNLATTTTVNVHGRPHVSEGATPVEWEFAGFAPDKAFQDKLRAYRNLRHRFYLIDHRNRAWVVSFAQLDLVPRKRTRDDQGRDTDWMADYSVKAVLYSQTPQEVS